MCGQTYFMTVSLMFLSVRGQGLNYRLPNRSYVVPNSYLDPREDIKVQLVDLLNASLPFSLFFSLFLLQNVVPENYRLDHAVRG